jgi:hypothetical protein
MKITAKQIGIVLAASLLAAAGCDDKGAAASKAPEQAPAAEAKEAKAAQADGKPGSVAASEGDTKSAKDEKSKKKDGHAASCGAGSCS